MSAVGGVAEVRIAEVGGQAPGWFVRWRIAVQRRSLLGLSALSGRVSRAERRPAHLLVGERGELEALFFLRQQGFVVVARRWRSPELNGDLDLVAWEGETLCFVEVKTRSQRDQTPAALAIDGTKRRMLSQMARAYLRLLRRPGGEGEDSPLVTRFDFVSVYLVPSGVEVELLRNAFAWREDGSAKYRV